MKRRTLLRASAAAPLVPYLAGCAKTPEQTTGYYEEGIYLSENLNFGPVDVETTAFDLPVTGSLPEELTGRYLRNGPNPVVMPDPDSYHWFIGDGMIHGVRLNEGKAEWYRNRWVRTKDVVEHLGEDPAGRNLGASANTHVIGHGGRTWAIVESGPAPIELDYELSTIGVSPSWGSYTAHPKVDPETGELHAIGYNWAEYRDHVKYTVRDADGNLSKSVDIPTGGMTMIHDMSLTKNYVVIYDLPVTVSFLALAGGASFPFRWDDDYEPRVGLMPRDGDPSQIIWSSVSQNYAYHPMNAYEDAEGRVVIDICRYDKMFAADTHGPFGDSLPRLDRWTINPATATLSETVVDETPQEFPRVHPELNSKPYQFGYTLAVGDRSYPGIFKHDMKSGKRTAFDFGAGRQGAEAVFVPRDGATAEDDGYLMTYVFDGNRRASDLVIIDANDMSHRATVQLPARVPYGFHGSWISDDDMMV